MTFHSLYRLERRGLLQCPIVGVAVDDWSDDDLRSHARAAIIACGETIDEEVFSRLAARLSYLSGDFAASATFERLATKLDGPRNPVFYLEVPPALFGMVIKGLSGAGLTENARVVVEKPFGHDLASAKALKAEARAVPAGGAALPDRPFPGQDGARRDPLSALRRTRSSSRSGTATTSSACRSRWPRTSASRIAATSTTPSVRCATDSAKVGTSGSARRRVWPGAAIAFSLPLFTYCSTLPGG